MSDMLTREELHAECRKLFDALPDRGEMMDGIDDAVLKLNKQAAQAIDLQAELADVKGKLDAVRAIVDDSAYPNGNCLFLIKRILLADTRDTERAGRGE